MKSKIDMLKSLEALQHQSAASQQRHRNGNFRDDQNIQPSKAGHAWTSLVAFFKTRHDFAFARSLPCRHQSENHAGYERNEHCKNQNASVDPKIMKESSEGNLLDRIQRRENRRNPIRK